MKSLSLTKPHVLVMVGLPGAGKSFFAEHFAKTFYAPLVSTEAIKQVLDATPSYTQDKYSVVRSLAELNLGEIMKTKETVIYDGIVITMTERRQIASQIRKTGYEPLFVWVQTDTVAAEKRARKNGVPDKIIETDAKRFTPLSPSEHFVVISGKHTYASQLKVVLTRLSQGRTKAVNDQAKRPPSSRHLRIQ